MSENPRKAAMIPSDVMGEAHMPHDQHRINAAAEQRAVILRQAKNQTYRALVSLIAAVAKVYGSPREAYDMVRGEFDKIEKDIHRAEKKAARKRTPKGDDSLEEKK